MRRLFSTVLLSLSALMFCCTVFAAASQGTPEGQVSAFYSWYISLNARLTYPLLDKRIFEFVSKDTVNRLRSDYKHDRLPGDSDYFLKVQDEDDKDWITHIAMHPAVTLGDVTVVPVTFGSTDKVSVLVFMRKIDGLWKIIKVDDTADYK